MGVHACGHVGLFPGAAVWVPLSQMCDGSITGVSEKRKQEMSFFFFKKGVLHLMLGCQVAICPVGTVPMGTSCVGCSGDDERPGGSGRHGILLPTAGGDSITFRIPVAKWRPSGLVKLTSPFSQQLLD